VRVRCHPHIPHLGPPLPTLSSCRFLRVECAEGWVFVSVAAAAQRAASMRRVSGVPLPPICAVMGGLELLNDRDELQRYGCNKDEND
jgi:hypothetical protein